jgi:glutaredoxin-like protein NrdH
MKTHVDGTDKGNVMLYALSTCVWCSKTKGLLSELGVAYDYVDIDLLEPHERRQVLLDVEKYNPAKTFPTLIIGSVPIRGFKEEQVRELLA